MAYIYTCTIVYLHVYNYLHACAFFRILNIFFSFLVHTFAYMCTYKTMLLFVVLVGCYFITEILFTEFLGNVMLDCNCLKFRNLNLFYFPNCVCRGILFTCIRLYKFFLVFLFVHIVFGRFFLQCFELCVVYVFVNNISIHKCYCCLFAESSLRFFVACYYFGFLCCALCCCIL